jgi:hypothetical protein
VQAISAAEEEAAKKKVGSAAALKQLEKLRKEAAKTSKEAEKVSEELLARKEEHKVNNGIQIVDHTCLSCRDMPCSAHAES